MRRLLSTLLPILMMVFAMASPAQAMSGIHDNAGVFKSETISTAQDLLHQIRNKSGRDVYVETYPSVPQDREGELQTKGKTRFYDEWAEDIGREHAVNGVVILIVKDPGHLEVNVGNVTRKTEFTVQDRDGLRDKMLADLNENNYDGALIDGLKLI